MPLILIFPLRSLWCPPSCGLFRASFNRDPRSAAHLLTRAFGMVPASTPSAASGNSLSPTRGRTGSGSDAHLEPAIPPLGPVGTRDSARGPEGAGRDRPADCGGSPEAVTLAPESLGAVASSRLSAAVPACVSLVGAHLAVPAPGAALSLLCREGVVACASSRFLPSLPLLSRFLAFPLLARGLPLPGLTFFGRS